MWLDIFSIIATLIMIGGVIYFCVHSHYTSKKLSKLRNDLNYVALGVAILFDEVVGDDNENEEAES